MIGLRARAGRVESSESLNITNTLSSRPDLVAAHDASDDGLGNCIDVQRRCSQQAGHALLGTVRDGQEPRKRRRWAAEQRCW